MAELQEIRGIGPATAALLGDHGLTSVKKLAKADLDTITGVPGFGPTRARAVQAEARAALPAKGPERAKQSKGPKEPTAKSGKKKSSKASKNKKAPSKKKKKAKKG